MKQPYPLDINNLPNNTPSGEYPKGTFFNQNAYSINAKPNQNFQINQSPNNYYPNQLQGQNNAQNTFQNQNPNHLQNGNINQNINQIVRNTQMSRGIHLGKSLSSQFIIEKLQERERKRILLDNIQTQMNLSKTNKLMELERKREEDAKYLKEMESSFPFGRGGGGAPIRDKNGMVVTSRRALISDPKYNLVSINVDDDYDEVWGKGKKYGLVNFKNRTINTQNAVNQIGNNPLHNTIQKQFFSNTISRNNSARQFNLNQFNQMTPLNQSPQMNNNNIYTPNEYYNSPPLNHYVNTPNRQIQYQQQPQIQYMNNNNNRPYSTIPKQYNQDLQLFDGNIRVVDSFPPENYIENSLNQNIPNEMDINNNTYDVNRNNNNIENAEINLSYDNYELDEEKKRRIKESYRDDLLMQIEQQNNKKLQEKQRKAKEEAEEEERLIRENEEIERKLQEEKNRNQQRANETNLINKNATIDIKNTRFDNVQDNQSASNQLSQKEKDQLEKFNQQEIESRMALNSEILKLRDQMQDQQANLYNQINSLKQETENANMQRYEALKEIELLKEELSKQRADEELRRKYVYDVIADDNSKIGGIYSQSRLPDTQIEKVVLPVQSEKNLYYDEKIRHPNRVIPTPKLTELDENQMNTESKFIDVNNHNVFNGLEVYHPATMNESAESREDYKINNRGFEVSGDYGTLRTYYKNRNKNVNNNKISTILEEKEDEENPSNETYQNLSEDRNKNIQSNIDNMDDGTLEVKEIYNRNLERLRYLNELESKFSNSTMNKGGEKDNYDDFIGKINNTCNLNY